VKRVAAAIAVALALTACSHEAPHMRAVKRVATTTSSTTSTSTSTTTTLPPPNFGATTSDNAAAAATAIAAAEHATLDPATPPDVVHSAAVALQLGYRRIAGLDVSIEQAVAAALPDDIRPALALNVAASRELGALGKVHAATPPATWHIAPVAGTDELLGYYREASAATGVPWEVLAAIHLVETKLGRVVGDSSAGAQGPMQFLPATWARYGQGDIHSNHDSIVGAARYLHANGAPERLDDALHHYNPTSKYVNAVKAYAQRMMANGNAYRGYHEWQVLFRTTGGTLLLPEGWPAAPAQPIAG
jgi:hypothetical protein